MTWILLLLIIILPIALFIKRKGSGSCCQTSGEPIIDTRNKVYTYRQPVQIEGMHCGHCVWMIQQALAKDDQYMIDIDYNTQQGIVKCTHPIDMSWVSQQIEKAGYTIKTA